MIFSTLIPTILHFRLGFLALFTFHFTPKLWRQHIAEVLETKHDNFNLTVPFAYAMLMAFFSLLLAILPFAVIFFTYDVIFSSFADHLFWLAEFGISTAKTLVGH